MEKQHYVVMGAGEVGFYLGQTLSRQGHDVVLIEAGAARAAEVDNDIDATVIPGNGASGGGRLGLRQRNSCVRREVQAMVRVDHR